MPFQGGVDEIEMSGVFSAAATDVLALETIEATDVFSADTTDVLSAAKAANDDFCPAVTSRRPAKSRAPGLIGPIMASKWILRASPDRKLRGGADGGVGGAQNIQTTR